MDSKYEKLLAPGKIGPINLRNHLMMAPMGTLNADHDGYITDNSIAFYKDMAKGGIGLIFVECTYTDELLSKGEENCQGITRNDQIVGYRRLATVIHDQGVPCILQLCHIGHQLSLAGEKESLGPSTMVEMMGPYPFPIRGATREEIKQIIQDFADCAYRAKLAGFDGVEIHGAIGHLINMFCTPFYNHRTDEYGGTPENRIRFMVEIIEAVHEKCGRNFPVIGRLCGCDFDPDGITLEEGIIHAKAVEKAGAVALHIVAGSNRNVRTINCQYDKRGDFMETARAIKEAVKIPVISEGGMTSPELAEKMLEEGYCDYIGLGRVMIADPDWVVKLKENRREDIRPCIRCAMGCVGRVEEFAHAVGLRCSVNPTCNLTRYRKLIPTDNPKKVCIIGGGPGGMEAALIACKRGHDVTLYEKRKFGGMLNEAAFDPSFKDDLNNLIDYYAAQMEKLPITVKMEEATVAKIKRGKFDIVIDATGSAPVTLAKDKGTDNVKVHTLYDFAQNYEMELGKRVVIVGGCFPNMEMAYSLAKRGHDVTVSSRKAPGTLGMDQSSPQFQRLSILTGMNGVKQIAEHRFVKATDEGALIEDMKTGEQETIPCDDIIVCRGFNGSKKLYEKLVEALPDTDIYRVGDCKTIRCNDHTTVGDAIDNAWSVAAHI